MRVAHGVVDQKVGNGITQSTLDASGFQALKHHRVSAIADVLGCHGGQNGLSRNAHVQGIEVALGIQACGQFALGDGVEEAMGHVFLAAPEQLDGRAGHGLGNDDRLGHKVIAGAAAKTTTQVFGIHIALVHGKSSRL